MQMSLFGNVAMKQVEKGKRAYTDGVEAWMKDGAMVLFEARWVLSNIENQVFIKR